MKVLSKSESLVVRTRFSQALLTGLVVAGLVITLITVLSIVHDRRESEAVARQNDLNINVAVHVQAELIFDQAYYSVKAAAQDLAETRDPAKTLQSLRVAMRYDPVSRFLFVKSGDQLLTVDREGKPTREVNALLGKVPTVTSGMTPVLLPTLTDEPTGTQYLTLLISSEPGKQPPLTFGSLVPVTKFNEYALGAGQRITSGEGLFLLDGTVIVRSSTGSAARRAPLGRKTAAGETVAQLAATQYNGDFTSKGLSGQDLTGTFSRSRRYPFIAASAQSTDLYLAPWRERSYGKAAALLLALAAMALGAGILSRANASLATSERLYRRLFDDVDEMIAVFHPDGKVVSLNASAMARLGFKRPEEAIGQNVMTLLRPSDGEAAARARLDRVLQGEHLRYEVTLGLAGGDQQVDCVMSVSTFTLNRERLLMAVAREITQEKRHLRQQEYLANHDPLTGLPNRHNLLRVLDCQIEDQAKTPIHLVLINLARFREINEGFGPRTGDAVLEISTQRLSRALAAQGWTLTRLGGADFVAYAIDVQAPELELVRQLIFQVLQEPVHMEGTEVQLHARLGFSRYPDDALDASQLLRCAELAATHARAGMTNWASYDRNLDKSPGHDLKIRTDLANAIRDDQLQLYFQPKVWLHDGSLAGAEALLRWKHPSLGWIPPVEFIPLAESTELIHALTRWVLGKSLDQIQQWQRTGRAISVAVNISANNLQDPDFNAYVMDLLRRKDVDPALLDLEVTEGALVQNPEIVLRRLEELRQIGMGLSIDDFGTGFSSLSYVSQFPFTSIKIDRSFVASLLSSEKDREVALVAISLGKKLQLKTIAEGVEDEATARELRKLDCDIGQGYLYGKPMPIDDFNAWVERHEAERVTRTLRVA